MLRAHRLCRFASALRGSTVDMARQLSHIVEGSPEWHALRSGHLSASRIAGLIDLDKDSRSKHHRWFHGVEERVMSSFVQPYLDFGVENEPRVAEAVAVALRGVAVVEQCTVFRAYHNITVSHNFIRGGSVITLVPLYATPDRIIRSRDGCAPLEIKTVPGRWEHEPRLAHVIQLLAQMAVLSSSVGFLARWKPEQPLQVWVLRASPAVVAWWTTVAMPAAVECLDPAFAPVTERRALRAARSTARDAAHAALWPSLGLLPGYTE